MANYVWSDFGVLTSTPVDAVNDSTYFQVQSTAAFTVSPVGKDKVQYWLPAFVFTPE